jgi:lipoprotein-anchoring transpeptidase ErfK/SrfK
MVQRLILPAVIFLALAGLMGGCARQTQSQGLSLPFPMSDIEQSDGLPCTLPQDVRGSSIERWIEVSLSDQLVRLCEGSQMAGEYLAATGTADRSETTTFPGLFMVHNKNKGPVYLSQFDVYISDWVGFDQEHANGFHSLPKDKIGRVLDDRLGQPVSHGCVRTAQSAAVYDFAAIGMKVWVH